jgi:predicted dehydrogenase
VLQVPIVLEAAAAGKHVFCEKPVAPSAEEALRMLRAVEGAGVVHAVDFLFPELAAWRQARQVVRQGTLGALRQVALSWRVETYAVRTRSAGWKLRTDQGGGTLNNFVSHSLYNLEWLLGPIERVAARLSPREGPGDARVDAWLELAGGVPGTLSVAADAFLGSGHRLEVYGDEGTLVLENRMRDHASGFVLSMGTRAHPVLEPVEVEAEGSRGAATEDGRVAAAGAIAGRFLDAIAGGAAVTPGLREGLRVQELIAALRRADEARTWRRVESVLPRRGGPGDQRGASGQP